MNYKIVIKTDKILHESLITGEPFSGVLLSAIKDIENQIGKNIGKIESVSIVKIGDKFK